MLKHLKRVGGQNPIEAAKLGCKIYYGPYVYNFQEIYELLAKNKVAAQINNSDELVNGLLKDLSNDKNEFMNFIPTINILAQEILDRSIQKINKEILNENS